MEAAPKKKGVTKRKGRTIDPKEVTDLESWTKAYKNGYKNIVIGKDGSFFVLDPTLTNTDLEKALESPVATIPHKIGDDYLAVLNNPVAPTELRAAAETTYTNLRAAIKGHVDAVHVSYGAAEEEMLEAVLNWKSASDAASRGQRAIEVGKYMKAMAEAGEELRAARYPRSYIREQPLHNDWLLTYVPAIADARDRVVRTSAAGTATHPM